MIIDHLGYFLYPEVLWLRAIGRMAFPLFFLLIWRNESKKIWLSLIIGACLVQGTLRFLSFRDWIDLWQLNILPAAIIVKLLLNGLLHIWNRLKKFITSETWLSVITLFAWLSIAVLCVLILPYSREYIEYGSMVLGTAIIGRLVKLYHKQWRAMCLLIWVSFRWRARINNNFPFDKEQRISVYAMRAINIALIRYMSKKNSVLHIGSFDNLILFISKQAVRIYVIHFLALMWVVFLKNKLAPELAVIITAVFVWVVFLKNK